jgi:hypothetical protein
MPRHSPRPCREYEREWQGRYVDRNLSDDWLVALNALDVFRLISICEGHLDGPGGRASAPHVNLRLRPKLVRAAYAFWDDLSVGLAGEFGRLFSSASTVVEAELRLQVRLGPGGVVSRPDMVIKLRGVRVRASRELEPEVVNWFSQVVAQSRSLDQLVAARIGSGGRRR